MPYDDEEEEQNKKLKKKVATALKNMQIEQERKEIMKQLLEVPAYDRLMNIRIANHELYAQVTGIIISLAQSNRIQGKLGEKQLMSLINRITFKKETTIHFEHK
jgi:programmed cell death protein 5